MSPYRHFRRYGFRTILTEVYVVCSGGEQQGGLKSDEGANTRQSLIRNVHLRTRYISSFLPRLLYLAAFRFCHYTFGLIG